MEFSLRDWQRSQWLPRYHRATPSPTVVHDVIARYLRQARCGSLPLLTSPTCLAEQSGAPAVTPYDALKNGLRVPAAQRWQASGSAEPERPIITPGSI